MSGLQDRAISPSWTTSRAVCYALIDGFMFVEGIWGGMEARESSNVIPYPLKSFFFLAGFDWFFYQKGHTNPVSYKW